MNNPAQWSTIQHTAPVTAETRRIAATWKLAPAKYSVFVNGVVKPARIYVTCIADGRMRDVTELLPKLRQRPQTDTMPEGDE